ncbi:MAG TPA: hypothetical protein VKA46_18000 [Gemmataceae bacterium]|nr:hypothetical protein [Gemmataceae bacterium]
MPPSPDDVRRIVAEAVRPSRFFVGGSLRLEWDHVPAEDVSWEVFRGRLLDPAHTRERRTFEAWNVYLLDDGGRSSEPLLAVKLDAPAGLIHVVRAIHSYAWEAYDAGGNVILSRETKKWVRELVGTIDLADFSDADDLRDEIVCRLFQAVVGTNRLPLTSLEAPLPAFTFGELAYFHGPVAETEPMRSYGDLVERARPEGRREIAKFLETMVHAMPPEELPVACKLFEQLSRGIGTYPNLVFTCLRVLFNDVALSPFTDMPEKALTLARRLAHHFGYEEDVADYADLLSHLLRQIGRHLTAYDLVRFHHAGANYPDALLLDVVLRFDFDLIEQRPALFLGAPADDERTRNAKRLRRRGLRQAWLIRQRYRGYLVPDAPTSPGENARVLPAPHARVPEEQILNAHRRTKPLFLEEIHGSHFGDTARAILRQSILDLRHPNELRELGMALYLDRPLGVWKAPGEPDQTPMLAYEAFSRSIAAQRLLLLGKDKDLLPDKELPALREALQALPVSGVPVADLASIQRPGVVSLADAGKAAQDFIFLRTTGGSSTRDFFWLFDFLGLAKRFEMMGLLGIPGWLPTPALILGRLAPDGEVVLMVHEAGTLRKRLELSANPRDGYVIRAAVEYPRKGLRVRRVWEETGAGELRERDLSAEDLFVRPV